MDEHIHTLIIGSSGFLGSNLHHMLPDGFCLTSSGLTRWNQPVTTTVQKLIENSDISSIINCAVSYDLDQPQKLWATNYLLPKYYLQLAQQYQIPFITFGSFFEGHLGNYKREYIQSKLAFRSHFSEINYNKSYYLTLHHIYGIMDNPNKFIPQIVNNIRTDKIITLDDPLIERDFTPVELVKKAVLYLQSSDTPQRYFDVGTTYKSTTIDFVKKLHNYYNQKICRSQVTIISNRQGEKLDVIRSARATNVPNELKLPMSVVKRIEQQTFKDMFEC